MHIANNSYGMYLPTAWSRCTYLYPGPYYTPWLWFDGNAQGGYNTGAWASLISNRINQPSPITESIWGEYNTMTGNGTIYARFQNDSNATINANVLFVVTENNILIHTPNGDSVHNYVARAYVPSYSGSPVTINIGAAVTVNYPFTISASWNVHNIDIIAMIQNPVAVGTTKEVLQARKISILSLPGVEESNNNIPIKPSVVTVAPNPSVNGTKFAFSLPHGTAYKITIFDVMGRTIKTLNGIASGANELVQWHPNVQAGVYLYRFESSVTNTNGKIIVK